MNDCIRVGDAEIAKRFKPVNPKTHKGIQGHALLIGGSYGKIGSVCLSSKAALRTGCGLVTAFIPECGYQILQTAIPEAMVVTNEGQKYISKIEYDIKPNAIGIGPGMGLEMGTQKAFIDFLKHNEVPLVIDADAINILSHNKSAIQVLHPKTILTPHPKELQRLLGLWKSDDEKLMFAIEFSKQHNAILVIKGAPTIIVDGEQLFENTTGNAALATAGSGDVLTGIITSLLAQSYNAIDAAILGVYLHGLTADIAIPQTGTRSFIASDIIKYLGKAFLRVENYAETNL